MKRDEKSDAGLIHELIELRSRDGELTAGAKAAAAAKLGLSPTDSENVAAFYPSMTAPAAKHNISLCKSLSCHMDKSRSVYLTLKKGLGIGEDGLSECGGFSLSRVNCLGLCDKGPAMIINNRVYSEMTPAKAKDIIEKLNGGKKRK